MAEFPPELYPQQADVTREEILRQIFGDVGELHCGKNQTSTYCLCLFVTTLHFLWFNLFFLQISRVLWKPQCCYMDVCT